MKRIAILVAIVGALLYPTFSYCDAVSDQLKNMQLQIQALRQGSIQSNSGGAEAVAAVQALQVQFEAVKASIDANKHFIESQTENLSLRLGEMDARMAALEERLAIQGKQVTAAVAAVAPEAANEAELYQTALNQINKSEFLKAIATLKTFKKKFPKSDYNGSAQYWIGECFFTMRDYEQAIKEFENLKKAYPRSEKMPAALLKQGYAFIELDMQSDANIFLNTLIGQYPRSREANEAKDRLERMKKTMEEARATPQTGAVPLAPGVKVPEKEWKNSQEKYR